tara:strand:- start:1621 stop:1896 length:276 start_codon:yes stop_codon:yes gene_type:complete
MYILHLIVKDCCKHTVYVEFRKGETAITDAKKALVLEAKGEACEVVFCNDEGMPFQYESVEASNNQFMNNVAVGACGIVLIAIAFIGIIQQ